MPVDPRIALAFRPTEYLDTGALIALNQIQDRRRLENQKWNEQVADESMEAYVAAHDSAQGSDEQRHAAGTKGMQDVLKKYWTNGIGRQHGWDENQYNRALSTPVNYATAAYRVYGPEKAKELIDTKSVAAAEQGPNSAIGPRTSPSEETKQENVPLSDVRKPLQTRGLTQEPLIQSQEIKPGENLPGEKTTPQPITPVEQMPTQEVTAQAPPNTPEGMERQAQELEKQAARVAKLGTPTALKRSKDLMAEAHQRRSESAAAERNLLAEERIINQAEKAKNTNQALSDDAVKFLVTRYLKGDSTALTGYARNANAKVQLGNAIPVIAKQLGMSEADSIAKHLEYVGLQSGERTLGTRMANIEMAVTEAQRMAPLVQQASQNVPRSRYPNLNSLLLAYEKGTGDENVVALGIAVNSLINIYARAINPQGVATVSDKDHARELLSINWSHGQIGKGVDQLMMELEQARQAPGMVREEFRRAVTGEAPGPQRQQQPILPAEKQGKFPKAKGMVPPVGTEQKGYRFKGGDPSKKENWELMKRRDND